MNDLYNGTTKGKCLSDTHMHVVAQNVSHLPLACRAIGLEYTTGDEASVTVSYDDKITSSSVEVFVETGTS